MPLNIHRVCFILYNTQDAHFDSSVIFLQVIEKLTLRMYIDFNNEYQNCGDVDVDVDDDDVDDGDDDDDDDGSGAMFYSKHELHAILSDSYALVMIVMTIQHMIVLMLLMMMMLMLMMMLCR